MSEQLKALLAEAREELIGYIEATYLEKIRTMYPSIAQDYLRDMDLPKRLAKAIEE